MPVRRINDAALDLITSFEELRLTGYLPTPHDRPTAGWGHSGLDVRVGVHYTTEDAYRWLAADLWRAEHCVEQNTGSLVNDNQYGALVSLCFNIGNTAFANSTLVQRLIARRYEDAAAQFLVWDKQDHVTVPGLLRRRQAEKALFETPVIGDPA